MITARSLPSAGRLLPSFVPYIQTGTVVIPEWAQKLHEQRAWSCLSVSWSLDPAPCWIPINVARMYWCVCVLTMMVMACGKDDDDDTGDVSPQLSALTCVISQDTDPPHIHIACHCRCCPCPWAAQPLLLLWASMPLIPGLSNSPSPNPHYHPPSDGASAPFEADENGVGSSPFLSLSGCLSASSHQPCC